MIIDDKKYKLLSSNYLKVESIKKQIVIGHTFNHDMKHFEAWKHRHNGNYLKTAAFTIDIDGLIHQHFDPKYQSKYFNNLELDKKSIVILLENDGWLTRKTDTDVFYNWKGDIYNGRVVGKLWRGYNIWSNYSSEQFESAIELVKYLCDEYYITKEAFGHNTKVDGLTDYEGVLYKSNLDRHYTDLSPSWNCAEFKNKLETK